MSGRVVSVNVSLVASVPHDGKTVVTGIFKKPVAHRIAAVGAALAGDAQADLAVHGGPDRAIYAYAAEDYAWWEASLERVLPPGTFGENLTLRGIDVTRALVGERWRVGSTIVRVTSPRVPCYKLAMALGDPHFVRRFGEALRPGAYLAIEAAGDLAAGDEVAILSRPSHALTLEKMTEIYLHDRTRSAEFLVPELPERWRTWALAQRATGAR